MSGSIFPWGRQLALTPFHSATTVTAYVALCRVVPAVGASGSTLSEPAQGYGYSRVRYDFKSANWTAADSDILTNTAKITFPTVTSQPWGWVSGWAITSSVIGGEVFVAGALQTARTFDVGDTPAFAVSAIRFGIHG